MAPHMNMMMTFSVKRYGWHQKLCIFNLLCKANLSISKSESLCIHSFEEDFKEQHIPTTSFQKALLSTGSAITSLLNPSRPDSIAVFGEASGAFALKLMLKKMEENEEGKSILQDTPRINSKTVDLNKLKDLPPNTLGYAYIKFLEDNKVTPDSRQAVQFVDDIKLAYVMQRYRESHDLIHTMLGMPTNMLGEVAVKWVEGIQTQLPMCIGGALFGPLRFAPKQRLKYIKHYLPWAIKTGREAKFLLNVYWEKRWEQPLDDLLKEMNVQPLQVLSS